MSPLLSRISRTSPTPQIARKLPFCPSFRCRSTSDTVPVPGRQSRVGASTWAFDPYASRSVPPEHQTCSGKAVAERDAGVGRRLPRLTATEPLRTRTIFQSVYEGSRRCTASAIAARELDECAREACSLDPDGSPGRYV